MNDTEETIPELKIHREQQSEKKKKRNQTRKKVIQSSVKSNNLHPSILLGNFSDILSHLTFEMPITKQCLLKKVEKKTL